jgi:CRISPR-associated protein Cas1
MFIFRPRQIPYDSIVIEGHSGYISFQALHWLSRNNVPVFIMNFDGSVLSSILPPIPVKADVRIAQIKTASDSKKTLTIAKALFQAKIERSLQILDWLAEAYDIEAELLATKREAQRVSETSTVPQLRTAEGRVALRYWQAFRQCLPKELRFQGRGYDGRNRNASDSVNAVLNYGYGFLQCECRKAVNSVGLEPSIGYSHTTTEWQTKESLVLDLMEPYRWLVDLTVFQLFESGVLNADSCFFQESDYCYRIFTESKGKLLDALREQFNSGVKYYGRTLKWDVLIAEKVNELARFLTGKTPTLNFTEPPPVLERTDSKAVRETILNITQSEAKKLGIGKGTLHYLRKRARSQQPFRIYSKVSQKIG